jgi:hypothetical protein
MNDLFSVDFKSQTSTANQMAANIHNQNHNKPSDDLLMLNTSNPSQANPFSVSFGNESMQTNGINLFSQQMPSQNIQLGLYNYLHNNNTVDASTLYRDRYVGYSFLMGIEFILK